MPATLHIIDPPPVQGHPAALTDDPGAMWREPDWDVDGREGWAIVLPNHAGLFYTTMRAPDAEGKRILWDVTGTPPRITVSPSINAGDNPGVGNWHGHINDGVMTP